MSRRHRSRNRHSQRRDARPNQEAAPVATEAAPQRGRDFRRERAPLIDHSVRHGVQGAGHPSADAPFQERLAPYKGVVDHALAGSAKALCDNVDVSFMRADFSRFVSERMLVIGMHSLLLNAGKTRGAEVLEMLVGMVEAHGAPKPRNGHANGHRAGAASPEPAERGMEMSPGR